MLAAAIATGCMQWDSYERLHDPAIRRLLPKIRCEHSAEIEAHFPANMSGTVSILARGKTFVKTVIVPRGEPSTFPTAEELVAKFASLANSALGAVRVQELATAILQVDQLHSIADLVKLGPPSIPRMTTSP